MDVDPLDNHGNWRFLALVRATGGINDTYARFYFDAKSYPSQHNQVVNAAMDTLVLMLRMQWASWLA